MARRSRRMSGKLKGDCKWFPGSDCRWCKYNAIVYRDGSNAWDGVCILQKPPERQEQKINKC